MKDNWGFDVGMYRNLGDYLGKSERLKLRKVKKQKGDMRILAFGYCMLVNIDNYVVHDRRLSSAGFGCFWSLFDIGVVGLVLYSKRLSCYSLS